MMYDEVVISLPSRSDRLAQFRARWGDGPVLRDGVAASTPQYGCLQAHRNTWQQMTDNTLVLEDDALSLGTLKVPAELPSDWDLLYLGGQHAIPPVPLTGALARCRVTMRTHAYLTRLEAVPKLLEVTAAATPIMHLDVLLARATHQLNAYAVTPWQVAQAAGWSDITNKSEPMRSWNERDYY